MWNVEPAVTEYATKMVIVKKSEKNIRFELHLKLKQFQYRQLSSELIYYYYYV